MTMTKQERERVTYLRAQLSRGGLQPLTNSQFKRELAGIEERVSARSITPESIVERHNAAAQTLGITSRMSYSPRGGWFTVATDQYPGNGSKMLKAAALREVERREAQFATKREQGIRDSARSERGVLLPQVHLNGTSRGELRRQTRAAILAIDTAYGELQRAAPHGRDFYTIPGFAEFEAIEIASREHEGRLRALESVLRDLQEIEEHLMKEGDCNV